MGIFSYERAKLCHVDGHWKDFQGTTKGFFLGGWK